MAMLHEVANAEASEKGAEKKPMEKKGGMGLPEHVQHMREHLKEHHGMSHEEAHKHAVMLHNRTKTGKPSIKYDGMD